MSRSIPAILLLASAIAASLPARAADLGQRGEMFPIGEEDLLAVIEARLAEKKASGDYDALKEELRAKTEDYLRAPPGPAHLTPATEPAVRYFDPTFIVKETVRDHRGRVLARAGQRINPFDHMPFTKRLILFDGTRPEEVARAIELADEAPSRLIAVRGAPIELGKAHKRPIWFDQNGRLSDHFGVRRTLTLIEQDGRRFRLTEIPL